MKTQNDPVPSPQPLHELRAENLRLLSENEKLKKDLENELLLHKNLFRQWKELNDTMLTRDSELTGLKRLSNKGISRSAFYGILGIAIMLAALDVYYLLSDSTGNSGTTIPATVMIDSLPVTNVKTTEFPGAVSPSLNAGVPPPSKGAAVDSATYQKKILFPGVSRQGNDSALRAKNTGASGNALTGQTIENVPVAKKADTPAGDTAAEDNTRGLGLYTVKSKAYLYNSPDEGSRLNTFIVHWDNASNTLTALDERNGFIYIEFKNHLGQLSKGWLRKIDLDRI